MTLSRRTFLAGAGSVAGVSLLAPVRGIGHAFGAPVDPTTTARRRLVVVFLRGGNDGLNTIVPRGDLPGDPRLSLYRKARPTLALKGGDVLPLGGPGDDGQLLGLNPQLRSLAGLYDAGRVAIVQGVGYPKSSFSHFASTDIWHAGDPTRPPTSGWLGRHLDRHPGGEGELRGLAVGEWVPLMLRGRSSDASAITSLAAGRFVDGTASLARARHEALAQMARYAGDDPLRREAAEAAGRTADFVDVVEKVPPMRSGDGTLVRAMLTARSMLEQPLGVETIVVTDSGYDTHANQAPQHWAKLGNLDEAIAAFFLGRSATRDFGVGPLSDALAARTVVLVVSEFGRRIHENGAPGFAGTDHGMAGPVFVIGPPAGQSAGPHLVAGLHGDHPPLGTAASGPAANVAMTTDLRSVYRALLEDWLGDEDATLAGPTPLALFRADGSATAAAPGRSATGVARGPATTAGARPTTSTSAASGSDPHDPSASRRTGDGRHAEGAGASMMPLVPAALLNVAVGVGALRLRRSLESAPSGRDGSRDVGGAEQPHLD